METLYDAGTLFKIVERIPSKPPQRSASPLRGGEEVNNLETDRDSDKGSVISDYFADGTRIMTLRATDPEVRSLHILCTRSISHYSLSVPIRVGDQA